MKSDEKRITLRDDAKFPAPKLECKYNEKPQSLPSVLLTRI